MGNTYAALYEYLVALCSRDHYTSSACPAI